MNEGQLPLSVMRPVDIRNLKEPGFIFPIEKHSPSLAVTFWDEVPTAVVLDGPNAFTFFKIDARARVFGLFVKAPEIVVNVSSAMRGEGLWEKHGVLMLESGRAHVVATRAGDSFGDPVNVPLWQDFGADEAEGRTIGFSNWSLRILNGTKSQTIWQSSVLDGKP